MYLVFFLIVVHRTIVTVYTDHIFYIIIYGIKKDKAKTAVRIIFKTSYIYIVHTIRLERFGSQKPIFGYKIYKTRRRKVFCKVFTF